MKWSGQVQIGALAPENFEATPTPGHMTRIYCSQIQETLILLVRKSSRNER